MRITEITEPVTFKVAAPAAFSPAELAAILELIQSESQVAAAGLLNRIKQSKLISIAIAQGKIVGISALKIPNNSYKQSVFANAGVPELATQFPYEMGWKVVLPEYRGQALGLQLSQRLLSSVNIKQVFATVRSTNQSALKPMQQLGFAPLGNTFTGSSGNKIILLTVQ
jgi:predicted GNAT family N-acyltransferase